MRYSLKLVALAVSLLSSADAEKECSLDCNGRGTCKFGPSHIVSGIYEMPWHKYTEENGMHCECDEGYAGLKCGIEEVLCGEDYGPDHVKWHRCHHGSKCVEKKRGGKGEHEYHCDCTSSFEKGFRTAGKFCEYVETTKCDGELFCANQGKCVNEGSDNAPNFKCECPSGFEGPRCEYRKDEAPECTLKCQNNGSCVVGMKDHPALHGGMRLYRQEKHLGFQHCVCPEGWAGLQCDVPSVECETEHGALCFNGGQCVAEKDGKNTCDCTTAVNSDTSFAGPTCLVPSMKFCDPIEGRDAAQEFCTHGGECPDEQYKGCKCPDSREGPHCEFAKGYMPDCNLDCQNDGQCRFGSKTAEWADLLNMPDLNKTVHDNGMHCSCPSGFAGVKCEIEYETCHAVNDKNPHICQHGGSCKAEGKDSVGDTVYSCDCSTSDISVAGQFCEHIAEEFCVRGEESGVTHSFCTNGGKCKKKIDKDEGHAGCHCTDDFDGPHCEVFKMTKTLGSPTSDGGKGKRKTARIFLAIFLVALSVGVVAVLFVYKRIKSRSKNEIENQVVDLHTMSTMVAEENLAPKGELEERQLEERQLEEKLEDVEII